MSIPYEIPPQLAANVTIREPDKRATAVIVTEIDAGREPDFFEWMQGITTTAHTFEGFHQSELYPPGERATTRSTWVTLLHFDTNANLTRWVNSPARREWIRQFDKIGRYELRALQGIDGWFDKSPSKPASWKMALTVLLTLYPTTMLATLTFKPWLSDHLSIALLVLISNTFGIAVLTWLLMPVATNWLTWWLYAHDRDIARDFKGAAIVTAITAVFVVISLLLSM